VGCTCEEVAGGKKLLGGDGDRKGTAQKDLNNKGTNEQSAVAQSWRPKHSKWGNPSYNLQPKKRKRKKQTEETVTLTKDELACSPQKAPPPKKGHRGTA